MVENYYSENHLQNCLLEDGRQKLLPLRELNSDAAIRVKSNNGKFWAAIEYERRKKSSSKYIKKFIDYYLRAAQFFVFFEFLAIFWPRKKEFPQINCPKMATQGDN